MLPNLLKGIQEKVQESIKKTGQLSTGSGKLKCDVCGSKKVRAEIERSSRLPCYIFFNDVLKFDYPKYVGIVTCNKCKRVRIIG